MAKKEYTIPEDLCWEGVVYDTNQVLIPASIREMLGIKPQMKIKFGIVAIVKEKKREILATDIKPKEKKENKKEEVKEE